MDKCETQTRTLKIEKTNTPSWKHTDINAKFEPLVLLLFMFGHNDVGPIRQLAPPKDLMRCDNGKRRTTSELSRTLSRTTHLTAFGIALDFGASAPTCA